MARIVELHVSDRLGDPADIVLGHENLGGYYSDPYFGATIGRFANRIGDAEFTLAGKKYQLAQNNNGNHLHGGTERSFDKVIWDSEIKSNSGSFILEFSYTSPDGEEGYPGSLDVKTTYTLSD